MRFTALVIDEAQLVADPAIIAVLLQEPVFEGVATLTEQETELALHPCKIVRMHTVPPEVGAVEIVARLVAQPFPDVLTDIGGAKIPRCLEAVNHRRRGGQQLLDMDPCRRHGFLSRLAVRDVAPRADDLVRLAALVIDQAQLVADPAIIAVLLQEPVLESVVALLEQLPELALHPCKIVRMHTVAPEVGAVEVVARLVAQPLLDVLAD